MIILAYLGCVQNFTQLDERADFLHPFIWSRDAISQWIRQKNSDNATFLSRVITGDKSWICGYDPLTKLQSSQQKSPNSQRPKKARQMSRMHIIFFDLRDCSQRICPGRLNSQFYTVL
jgi:hypothetical protein